MSRGKGLGVVQEPLFEQGVLRVSAGSVLHFAAVAGGH